MEVRFIHVYILHIRAEWMDKNEHIFISLIWHSYYVMYHNKVECPIICNFTNSFFIKNTSHEVWRWFQTWNQVVAKRKLWSYFLKSPVICSFFFFTYFILHKYIFYVSEIHNYTAFSSHACTYVETFFGTKSEMFYRQQFLVRL